MSLYLVFAALSGLGVGMLLGSYIERVAPGTFWVPRE